MTEGRHSAGVLGRVVRRTEGDFQLGREKLLLRNCSEETPRVSLQNHLFSMGYAFVTRPPIPLMRAQARRTCPRMSGSADDVVNEKYPLYARNKAPFISFNGEEGFYLENKPVKQFAIVDKLTEPLFDYSDPSEFQSVKPQPPSSISWPSGDGRGKAIQGTKGSFDQANIKEYGPFPDFFKRSCDG